MSASNFILRAYSIDDKGKGISLTGEVLSKAIKSEQFTWVHLDADSPESRKWLREEIDYLDDIIIEALLADETRPRIPAMAQEDSGSPCHRTPPAGWPGLVTEAASPPRDSGPYVQQCL